MTQTEWLFNVYPQRGGKVLIVLWSREKYEDENDRIKDPYSAGAISFNSIEIVTNKTDYLDDIQFNKYRLAEKSGVTFEYIRNNKPSEIDFTDKEILYSDWNN